MKNTFINIVETIVRKIAKKHLIIEQTKLHKITIDDELLKSIITVILSAQLKDIENGDIDLRKMLNVSFKFFYLLGIEASIIKHLKLETKLDFENLESFDIYNPQLPYNTLEYVNYSALTEMSDETANFIEQNESKFNNLQEIIEQVSLIAANLGVELTTQIPIKSSDFGIEKNIDIELKVNTVHDISDMTTIYCPFCSHAIYTCPKDKEYRDLAKINNCSHVAMQYFQHLDKKFTMGENFMGSLSIAINDFLNTKDNSYLKNLNDFIKKAEYNVDDFLKDIYVNEKITEQDELSFLGILADTVPNYELKVNNYVVNGNIVVNYFMKEKNF
jgi:hypothetical protein